MIFPMNSSRDCAQAWEAMPWVLERSAPQEQSAWLIEHLEHCDQCRTEYARQERLRRAMSLPPEVQVDANAGLKRLLDRLDAHDSQPQPAPPPVARNNNWVPRALAAAVLLQALAIGVLGMKLWSGSDPAYHTFSQNAAAPAPAGAIHVVPDAAMTMADWNALVRALHLRVTGGPNDVGAYVVVPAAGAGGRETALRQLLAARGIRLAEPVADVP
jgi:hypothetical protein